MGMKRVLKLLFNPFKSHSIIHRSHPPKLLLIQIKQAKSYLVLQFAKILYRFILNSTQ